MSVEPKDSVEPQDAEEPTEQERAEAEALAQALSQARVPTAAADAWATAQLMRLDRQASPPEAAGEGSPWRLSDAAEQRILNEVLTQARPVVQERPRRVVWAWLGSLVPVAALAIWFGLRTLAEPSPSAVSSLPLGSVPGPSVAMLQAQAAWITTPSAKPEFDVNMRQYRQQVYAALERR